LADRSRLLDGLAASQPEESDLSFEGNAALIGAEPVSGNYAAVLGARTMLGRWFDRDDEPAAVISYNAWQRLFHSDPEVLGKTVRSESHTYTVVGVLRRSSAASTCRCASTSGYPSGSGPGKTWSAGG
jgi:hypothetical protein